MTVGLSSPLTPESIGGGYTFEQEIFAAILELAPESNHEFVIFDLSQDSKLEARLPGFRYVRLKRPLSDFVLGRGHRWERRWVDKILRRERIEFFLNISFETITVDIPFLVMVWDLQHRLQPFFPEVSLNGVWRSRENFYTHVLRRAAFVITGTKTGKREIETFYGVHQERIRILPHPTPRFALDASSASEVDLSKYDLPSGYVFYPAQFWSHKNHIAILRAVLHLKEADNLCLPVVFTGSDQGNEGYVRDAVRDLGLQKQVYFLGYVPRRTLRALYQNALVLCYVSFFGPENLPPLEAFALGCPVIAADVAGAREQLGDAAIRVNPADELEIAQALKLLFHDKVKRESLIHRGNERALLFTGRDFAKALIGLLDDFQAIRRCWPANP